MCVCVCVCVCVCCTQKRKDDDGLKIVFVYLHKYTSCNYRNCFYSVPLCIGLKCMNGFNLNVQKRAVNPKHVIIVAANSVTTQSRIIQRM